MGDTGHRPASLLDQDGHLVDPAGEFAAVAIVGRGNGGLLVHSNTGALIGREDGELGGGDLPRTDFLPVNLERRGTTLPRLGRTRTRTAPAGPP